MVKVDSLQTIKKMTRTNHKNGQPINAAIAKNASLHEIYCPKSSTYHSDIA